MQEHAMPTILSAIKDMQKGTGRTSRYTVPFMEGLIGALVRFTATLYSPEVLKAAMEHNLVSVLTDLLGGATGSDEVQWLAALGLENLSYISIKLSQPPPEELLSKKTIILRLRKDSKAHNNSKKNMTQQLNICPVHRGVCTPATTFCLLEVGAIEGLLWQKCFCIVEKLLEHGNDRCMKEVTEDRMLPTALVSAFHRGDASTKQAAESILRRLHKMPDYSVTYVSMEF
jgi:hypothetical protein